MLYNGDDAKNLQILATLAEQLRGTGNSRFSLGDLAGARRDYEESLQILKAVEVATAPENSTDFSERVRACCLNTQLNIALCCLKAEPSEADRALLLCEAVLEVEPSNAKASYRKAKALLDLRQLERAETELVRACSLAPGDAAPRKDLESVRQQLKDRSIPTLIASDNDRDDEAKRDDLASTCETRDADTFSTPDNSENEEAALKEQDDFQQLLRRAEAGEDVGEETPGDVWIEVEEKIDRVTKATDRHADLWKEVHACLQERDAWEGKLRQMQRSASEATSLEAQIRHSKLRGAAASTKNKEYAAAGRAYGITERRVKKLDMRVLKLLREIRSIEQDPELVIDPANRLNDAMRDAVMQDDPTKVQELLSTLPNRMSSRRTEDIIQNRPELAIKELQSRINECKRQLAAQGKAK